MPLTSRSIDRRAVLHGALGACAGFALAPIARLAAAADAIQTTRVTDKLVANAINGAAEVRERAAAARLGPGV